MKSIDVITQYANEYDIKEVAMTLQCITKCKVNIKIKS